MFGSKLRAWMEAVRPKKKQHRKDKQAKNTTLLNSRPNTNDHTAINWKNTCLLEEEKKGTKQGSAVKSYLKTHNETNEKPSRYSATNLSSPESAYSTGYSTDGTSPGAGAPPEYLINSSSKKLTEESSKNRPNPPTKKQVPPSGSTKTVECFLKSGPSDSSTLTQDNLKIKENLEENLSTTIASSTKILGNISENNSVLVSPRQRNRIRTNPWLPGGTTSAVPSPLPVRQEVTMTAFNKFRNSPIHHRYLSPVSHRRSFSSSSCSSLSAGPNHSFDHHFPRSFSDEDDCTLNEMMGKYDESYVYEKETDILSDGDPTDCESDLDTGQDGGDEDENADAELDFIDNGSFLDIDRKIDNTGHCLYLIPSDMQRKRSLRRRTTRKVKESSDRRRRSSASKKFCRHSVEKPSHWSHHQDGSKSAGATPLSVRKSNIKARHKVQEELYKKRSNSVCLQRDTGTNLINKRDREADLKYKELIGQAEQIIRTMNINGLSPRRLPGPTNKRVELLRSTECTKPDVLLFKSKPTDEPPIPHPVISPSTASSLKSNRFSPKKNHLTNFIINNSPVLVRKELHQAQSPVAIGRSLTVEIQKSPLAMRKNTPSNQETYHAVIHPGQKMLKETIKEYREIFSGSPTTFTKNHHPKSILHKTEQVPKSILSPRHRRETEIPMSSSSSEEESFQRSKKKLSKSCPQSEPMRRKSYFGRNTFNNTGRGHGKTVAFNLNYEIPNVYFKNEVGSSENIRHQVLLNTIQSLKQSLEYQSASLQQTYKGTQRPFKY